MRLSVIIPTFNRPHMLARCLSCLAPSVQALASDFYEVIVTDDGWSIDTRLVTERCEFPVRYIEGPARGPAANRNHAAHQARSTWLAFTDDDCLPDANWLLAILTMIETGAADVIEGRTIANRPQLSLAEGSPINETGGKLWSCNFAVSRDFFNQLGGFDERFPYPGFEDVDLFDRCRETSARVLFTPEALIVHEWRPAAGWQHYRRQIVSLLIFMDKYPDHPVMYRSPHWLWMIARTITKDLPRALIKYRGRGSWHLIYILVSQIIPLGLLWFGRRPFCRYCSQEADPRTI